MLGSITLTMDSDGVRNKSLTNALLQNRGSIVALPVQVVILDYWTLLRIKIKSYLITHTANSCWEPAFVSLFRVVSEI